MKERKEKGIDALEHAPRTEGYNAGKRRVVSLPVIDVARERCQGRNIYYDRSWRIPWTARLPLSATSRHPRLDARDVRSKTIPLVFKAWAEKERKHGAVIFDDEKAISPSDTSGLVQALEKREIGLDQTGLFSAALFSPRMASTMPADSPGK